MFTQYLKRIGINALLIKYGILNLTILEILEHTDIFYRYIIRVITTILTKSYLTNNDDIRPVAVKVIPVTNIILFGVFKKMLGLT